MDSFSANVAEEFAPMFAAHQFVAGKAAWTNDYVVFVSRVTTEVLIYQFVRDDRYRDGALRCDLWLSPCDFPDDRLCRIGVGYHIPIGEIWDQKREVLSLWRRRIEILLPYLPALAPAVALEFADPPAPGMRHAKLLWEMRGFKSLLADKNKANVNAILDAATKVTEEKIEFKKLVSICKVAIEDLVKRDPRWKQIMRDGFMGKLSYLADGIANQAYLAALV